jgi:hypothetical protein
MDTITRRIVRAVAVLVLVALGICIFNQGAQAQTPSSAASAVQSSDPPPTITWPACVSSQTVLLIEDAAPWYNGTDATFLGADATELTAQNKNWCGINSSQLAGTNLAQFNEIMIPSDQPQAFYNNLFPEGAINSALATWVSAGGVLSANLADCGWQASSWSSASECAGSTSLESYLFVGGLTHVQEYDNTNNIVAPTDPVIADGLPCPSGNCAPVVNTGPLTDLDDWYWSSHGYFASLPKGTTTIITDSAGNPVSIEYPYGSGRVIATLNSLEWMYEGAPYYYSCETDCTPGSPSETPDKKLLANEISYQAVQSVYSTPPLAVPSTETGGTLTASYPSVIPTLTTSFPEGVIYNYSFTDPPPTTAYVAVNFELWNPTQFDTTRLPATTPNTWSGGTAVPPGTVCTLIGGSCVVIQYLCYDINYNPILPCDIEAPAGSFIYITPTYTASSPQPNPLIAIADDGAKNWANITIAPDPTSKTRGLNTDLFLGDLPPNINITAPAASATYDLHQAVAASYTCTDPQSQPTGYPTCTGTGTAGTAVPSGSKIDTASVGSKSFTVTSTDAAGATGTASVDYTVVCHYVDLVFNPSTVTRGSFTIVTGILNSCASTSQKVTVTFTLKGPLQPNACGSSQSFMFTTPPFTLKPNTDVTVRFPFLVPKKICPGTYNVVATTNLGGVAVDTSSAALTIQ